MKKLHLLLILVVVLTVVPFAAAPVLAEEGDDPGQAPVNIYIVSHGACSWDAFWCVEEKGNKDAARDLGVDITLITPDKFNPEQTAQDVDKALAANPDVLIVTVTDGVLFEEPLLRAIESGIPVIAYNAADWRPAAERIPYLTYIGQDEYGAATATSGFVDYRGLGYPTQDTSFMLAYDNNALYIAIVAQEQDTDNVTIKPRGRDGKIWMDDYIDMFIDAQLGMLGRDNKIAQKGRTAMAAMVAYQNMRVLMFTVFASLPDLVGPAIRAGSMKDMFTALSGNMLKLMKSDTDIADMARYLVGEITEVCGELETFIRERPG